MHKYFADISEELNRKSNKIKDYFATHKPSAGANREGLVANFLEEYLPKKFSISSGLILSSEGCFSNQADIIVADHMSNAPLFGENNEKLWLVESVYSLIEVKTQLTPTTIKDSFEKCRKFKRLKRNYAADFGRQNIKESLFVLWSFNAPTPQKAKENIEAELKNIPREEQPDFIIVPGSILVAGGHYYELVTLGQPSTALYSQKLAQFGGNIDAALGKGHTFNILGENSLLAWLTWFSSWLHAAGERRAPLNEYVPKELIWGIQL